MIVRNHVAGGSDDACEQLGVIAGGGIQIEHAHVRCHAEHGQHVGRLAARIANAVLGGPVRIGHCGVDGGPIASDGRRFGVAARDHCVAGKERNHRRQRGA
jgi:hypothetical protein